MKWLIVGANRETAEDVELIINAPDEQHARAQALRRGVLVETCRAAASQLSPRSSRPTAKFVALPPFANAAGLVSRPKAEEQVTEPPKLDVQSWRDAFQRSAETAKAFVSRRPWLAGVSGLAAAILLLALIEGVRTAQADRAARAEQRVLDAAVADESAQLEREKAQLDAARQSMTEGSANSETAAPSVSGESHQMTKREAIDGDPVISALLEQYPDLRDRIERGGTYLSTHTTLMVASGLLTLSDSDYIERFSSRIQQLPD